MNILLLSEVIIDFGNMTLKFNRYIIHNNAAKK